MADRSGRVGYLLLILLLLAAAVLAVWHAVDLGLVSHGQPGPGLFPFVAGATMLSALTILAAGVLYERRPTVEFSLAGGELRKVVAVVGVMALWIIVMPWLGYVVVTFAGVIALARLFGLRGWREALLLAVFTSLAVYVMFDWLLYLDLPRGIFAAE